MSPGNTGTPAKCSKNRVPVHGTTRLRVCDGRAAPDWDTDWDSLVHRNDITYSTQSANIDIAPCPLLTNI
jgi:hypothetical protein